MNKFSIDSRNLNILDKEKICAALQKHLPKYFHDVSVEISPCPDLSKEPYNLAWHGIGDYSEIVDLGGVPYLQPIVNRSKIYDLSKLIPESCGNTNFPKGWFINGAAAGPWPYTGTNCEMMVNMFVDKQGTVYNKSKVSLIQKGSLDKMQVLDLREEVRCCVLANLMVSSGSGTVLKISCKNRKSDNLCFTGSIRQALLEEFKAEPVALGGIFTVHSSSTKIHVMPDFSETPLTNDQKVNEWLRFFVARPPFLCQSVVVSSDPGLDLRLEHSHGWSLSSNPMEAGHYHYDTEPDNVVYEAIYSVASKIVRIDRSGTSKN